MKKLFYLLFLFTTLTHAQISLQDVEGGVAINDGDMITETQNQTARHIIVTNNYAYDINIRLELVSITNTDGSEFQICFGVGGQGGCHFPVAQGDVFDGGAVLSASASTGSNDIDFMQIDGTTFTTYPKDYVIKISALNTSDNSEISSVTFTYRYQPDNSIDQLSKDEFQLSVAHGILNINSKYTAKVSVYNLTGQKVKEVSINKGKSTINTYNFTKGIYIVRAIAGNKELYQRVIIN